MADSIPFWDEGDTLTAHCTAAVTGSRFVKISGARVNGHVAVAPAGVGEAVFGVAARDTASGSKVMVHRATSIIASVEVGATAVVAGGLVQSDAVGRAIPVTGGGKPAGTALDDVAAAGFAPIDRQIRA